MTALTFDFMNLRVNVVVSRRGARLRVSGTATFPAPRSDGRLTATIDGTLGDDDTAKRRVSTGRLQLRAQAVCRFRELRAKEPHLRVTHLYERVGGAFGVSGTSVRGWVEKADREDAPTETTDAPITEKQLQGAIFTCAWWSYRIGNLDLINGDCLRSVLDVLRRGYTTADLLATIDNYFAYDTDRTKFPFKMLTRFLRYDLDKWLIRAAETNDFLRSKKQVREAASNDLRTRRRAASDPLVRAELHRASRPACGTGLQPVAPSDPPFVPSSSAPSATSAVNPSVASSLRASVPSCLSALQSVEASSRFLDRIGFKDTARDLVASTDSRSIAARPAATMAEALARMPDAYRSMLLSCKLADRDALDQASATLPLWWDHLPETTRHNIDARVAAWLRDHPRAASSADRRKVLMLLPLLRPGRSGVTRLGVACRIA